MHAAAEVKELFDEYEAGKTPEALLVKDFDKVRANGPLFLELSPVLIRHKPLATAILQCSQCAPVLKGLRQSEGRSVWRPERAAALLRTAATTFTVLCSWR